MTIGGIGAKIGHKKRSTTYDSPTYVEKLKARGKKQEEDSGSSDSEDFLNDDSTHPFVSASKFNMQQLISLSTPKAASASVQEQPFKVSPLEDEPFSLSTPKDPVDSILSIPAQDYSQTNPLISSQPVQSQGLSIITNNKSHPRETRNVSFKQSPKAAWSSPTDVNDVTLLPVASGLVPETTSHPSYVTTPGALYAGEKPKDQKRSSNDTGEPEVLEATIESSTKSKKFEALAKSKKFISFKTLNQEMNREAAESVTERLRRRKRRMSIQKAVLNKSLSKTNSPYVINPRVKWVRAWDVMMFVLLIFVAILTPYEAVFLSTQFNFLFGLNRLIDLIFLIDLALNFFMAYFDEKEAIWTYELNKIQIRYLRTWFVIDLISILPVDWLSMTTGQGEDMKLSGGFSLFKLFKLGKLLRTLRAGRIFKRIETAMDIDYILVELGKFATMTLVLAHMVACMLGLFELQEDTNYTWMSEYFCVPNGVWEENVCERGHFKAFERYMAAMYWAVTTLTTIGYGDILAVNNSERVMMLFVMLVGAFQYGYIIGALGTLLATKDESKNRFIQTMTELNSFMGEASFPFFVRERLREYFKFRLGSPDVKSYYHIMDAMSPNLRREACIYTDGRWVEEVELFKNCPYKFVVECATVLQQQTYPPLERLFEIGDRAETMYIVKKGLVDAAGSIFRKYNVIKEECLYKEMEHDYPSHTMTFAELWTIERTDMLGILHDFPSVFAKIRKNAIRRIFKLEILAYTAAMNAIISDKIGKLFETDAEAVIFNGKFERLVRHRATQYYQKMIILWGLSVKRQKQAIIAVGIIKRYWKKSREQKRRVREQKKRELSGADPFYVKSIGIPFKRKLEIQLNQIQDSVNRNTNNHMQLVQFLNQRLDEQNDIIYKQTETIQNLMLRVEQLVAGVGK